MQIFELYRLISLCLVGCLLSSFFISLHGWWTASNKMFNKFACSCEILHTSCLIDNPSLISSFFHKFTWLMKCKKTKFSTSRYLFICLMLVLAKYCTQGVWLIIRPGDAELAYAYKGHANFPTNTALDISTQGSYYDFLSFWAYMESMNYDLPFSISMHSMTNSYDFLSIRQ